MNEERKEKGLEDEVRWLLNNLGQTREGAWIRRQWDTHPARLVGVILLFAAIVFRTIEWYFVVYFDGVPVHCGTELFGIALTVLLIDTLNTKRRNKERKAQLIRQMGSRFPEIAVTAAIEMRIHGWGFGEDDSLVEANLKGANLEGASLDEANLEGAHLYEANLSGAILYKANLHDAMLSRANLKKAWMSKAILEEAWLSNANLEKADLSDANLVDGILWDANLEGAALFGADLWGANMCRVNLEGAIGVTSNQLKDTANLIGATMPDGSSTDLWALRLFGEGKIDEQVFNRLVRLSGHGADEEEE